MPTLRSLLAERTAPEPVPHPCAACGPRRTAHGLHVLLLETGKHHQELFTQVVGYLESAGCRVTREPWKATEPAWGVPEMAAKHGTPDVVLRWEEHGTLFVKNTWRECVQWCYEHRIMPALIDWGYFAHYKDVLLDYYTPLSRPSLPEVWVDLPMTPQWEDADDLVREWREARLNDWARAEHEGPFDGTGTGYVLVFVQYSANGNVLPAANYDEWVANAIRAADEAGKRIVWKMPPIPSKATIPEGQIVVKHGACTNARLIRHACHSVVITSTVSAECIVYRTPVVDCGPTWHKGINVFGTATEWADTMRTPGIDDGERGRFVNFWLKRQAPREVVADSLTALCGEWRARYGHEEAHAVTPPYRAFYGVGRGMGNILMAVPAMKALAAHAQQPVEVASGKYASNGYRAWLAGQPFVAGKVPREWPDLHGFDVVGGVAWEHYVPPEAPDGLRLPPGPACRGPHETMADASPLRRLIGDTILPSGRMRVTEPVPDGLPVHYVVVAMDCTDKGGTQHPWNKRRWPHWEAFCKAWAGRVPLVFVGTDACAWAATYGTDMIGTMTPEQAAAVIEQADALVSIDCGLAHVAGAVRTPAVVLYGPTTSYREGPWYGGLTPVASGVRCRACFMDAPWAECKQAKCMDRIEPERVVDILERVLRRAGRPLEEELAFEQCQARLGYGYRHDIKPAQAREEMMAVWPSIRELCARRVLEIGSKRGGWMFGMSPTFAPYAQLVMVDVHPMGAHSHALDLLRAEEYDVTLHVAGSHRDETRDEVRALFGGQPVDVLHIDGDHATPSCLRDWELYSPLVRSGGLVIIHDLYNYREGVWDAWRDILDGTDQYRVAEWRTSVAKRRRGNQLGIAIARMA